MGVKEQYWKYSLVVILLLLGVVIFWEITPFLGGILGAMTVYILLRDQMIYLSGRHHMRRSIMAILILLETILIFLIPLGLIIWLMIDKLQDVNLEPRSIIDPIYKVSDLIREKTGYDLLSKANINAAISLLPRFGQFLMGSITSFVINGVVLLFVLYFMLIGGRKMESYIADLLPFNRRNKRDILKEFNMVVKSNAIGVPLLAIIQGAIAMCHALQRLFLSSGQQLCGYLWLCIWELPEVGGQRSAYLFIVLLLFPMLIMSFVHSW